MIVDSLFTHLVNEIKAKDPEILQESYYVKPKGDYLVNTYNTYFAATDKYLAHLYLRQVGEINYSEPSRVYHACEQQNDITVGFRIVIGAWHIASCTLLDRLQESVWSANFKLWEQSTPIKGKASNVRVTLEKGNIITQSVLAVELGGEQNITTKENLNFASLNGSLTYLWRLNECNLTNLCAKPELC